METNMTRRTAAATFVQISREELEEWINDIGYRGHWERDPKYAGVYLLKLSPSVAVKLSSTIGSRDDAMGVGKASMQLALVSTVTGRVLNKKAQGQSHFKRTVGWKKTWAAGVETIKKAYLGASDFYDVIAVIADRDAYKTDMIKRIETVPGWDHDAEMVGLYRKIERGGVLMPREVEAIAEAKNRRPARGPDPQRIEQRQEPARTGPGRQTPEEDPNDTRQNPDEVRELRLDALRKLWVSARRANDAWTMQFAEDVAKKFVSVNRRLSGPQLRVIGEKMKSYAIPDLNGKPAHELF